jgi:hypothetical protein
VAPVRPAARPQAETTGGIAANARSQLIPAFPVDGRTQACAINSYLTAPIVWPRVICPSFPVMAWPSTFTRSPPISGLGSKLPMYAARGLPAAHPAVPSPAAARAQRKAVTQPKM